MEIVQFFRVSSPEPEEYLSSEINTQLPFGVLYRLDQAVTLDLSAEGENPEVVGTPEVKLAWYKTPEASVVVGSATVPAELIVMPANPQLHEEAIPLKLSRLRILPLGAFKLKPMSACSIVPELRGVTEKVTATEVMVAPEGIPLTGRTMESA